MTDMSSQIVCNLTAPELKERKGIFRRKLTPHLVKSTYAAGSALLIFSRPEVSREMLETLIELEGECCPFFSFNLEETSDHFQLQITGPDGSENMVCDFFETSNEASCGCGAKDKSTGSAVPKFFASLVSLCVVACAVPPALAAAGLANVATGAWLGNVVEGTVIGTALFGFGFLLLQYVKTKRRKA